MKPFVQTTLQYKVQSKQLQEITEGEMGFEAFVLAHKRLVNLNALYQQYFVYLSEEKESQKITFSNFHKFVHEQGDEIGKSREETSTFLRHYFRGLDLDFNLDLRLKCWTKNSISAILFKYLNRSPKLYFLFQKLIFLETFQSLR